MLDESFDKLFPVKIMQGNEMIPSGRMGIQEQRQDLAKKHFGWR